MVIGDELKKLSTLKQTPIEASYQKRERERKGARAHLFVINAWWPLNSAHNVMHVYIKHGVSNRATTKAQTNRQLWATATAAIYTRKRKKKLTFSFSFSISLFLVTKWNCEYNVVKCIYNISNCEKSQRRNECRWTKDEIYNDNSNKTVLRNTRAYENEWWAKQRAQINEQAQHIHTKYTSK